MRLLKVCLLVGVLLNLISTPSWSTVRTSRTYGEFNGHHWLATEYDLADLWVSSNRCYQREPDAYSVIWNTTKRPCPIFCLSDFWARWPSGVVFTNKRCDGQMRNLIDLVIKYSPWSQTRPGKTAGGAVDWVMADFDFCTKLFRIAYPCGRAYSRMQINLDKWTGYSTEYQTRLLVHESAHVLGLKDHVDCSHTTVTDNGEYCVPLQSSGYVDVDRAAVVAVYPNWPYS